MQIWIACNQIFLMEHFCWYLNNSHLYHSSCMDRQKWTWSNDTDQNDFQNICIFNNISCCYPIIFPLRMEIMRLVFNGASSCFLKFLTGTIFVPQITSTKLQESLNPYKSKTFDPVANYLIISIITGRLICRSMQCVFYSLKLSNSCLMSLRN